MSDTSLSTAMNSIMVSLMVFRGMLSILQQCVGCRPITLASRAHSVIKNQTCQTLDIHAKCGDGDVDTESLDKLPTVDYLTSNIMSGVCYRLF